MMDWHPSVPRWTTRPQPAQRAVGGSLASDAYGDLHSIARHWVVLATGRRNARRGAR
jgi:hypothetical protein